MLPNLLIAAATILGQASSASSPESQLPPWNERTVRHLFSRAGFGASDAEIAEALRVGPRATVAGLMVPRRPWVDVEPVLVRWEEFNLGPDQVPLKTSKYATPEEAAKSMQHWRSVDRTQFNQYCDRWFSSMIAHDDPLRDHVTLFWHGLFTTSFKVVKRKYEIIQQHQWLRRDSLSTFSKLLHGLVEDPAMLQFLDNNTNVREHPNENLGRELMELYSLGEGNYTEEDVREAARALTGSTGDPEGRFAFRPEIHDDGPKTILGKTGAFGRKELVDILLEQPACANFIAGRLLAYFEGSAPDAARHAEYASFLRDNRYELQPFFEKLFLDPRFYREEIIGARVQGPIEFLVGFARKTGIEPPPNFLFQATALLGQTFYAPPTVRGWDEGMGWITNDGLLQRGNAAGVLLGVLFPEEQAMGAGEPMDASDPAMGGAADPLEPGDQATPPQNAPAAQLGATVRQMLFRAGLTNWRPSVDLAGDFARRGATSDEQIVDDACARWLVVPVDKDTRKVLLDFLAKERAIAAKQDDPAAAQEMALRRFTRILFSLPEAQLN